MPIAKKTSNILFEFDSLIDTDLALLIYIQLEFKDSKYFNKQVMKANDHILRALLLTRKEVNPLSVIIADEYKDSIDSLYNDIISKKYEQILNAAKPLDIFRFLETLKNTDGLLQCSVLCRNDIEEKIIRKFDKEVPCIKDGYNVKLYTVNALYIKIFQNIVKYKNVNDLSLYILNYDFNIEEGRKERIPKLNLSIILGRTNSIYLVDPYYQFNKPI